ncbi:hypothetical protein CDV36_008807 [Fusarium kuroshium]|uniref:Heterokaryon incompatibility domain-containing protein n=1 Tax=Fusarium kuroshium TaxID=2010991 RepID=A0A3M2S1W2_9HYPO|nr:hypothetical protein CDV36_008807 [Fusarium kuroshium]
MSFPPENVSTTPQSYSSTYSKYIHANLKDPQKDIRLFELLPGSFQDDVKLRIFHATLPEPKREARRLLMFDELQNTLPRNWRMFQTLTGRRIYSFAGPDRLITTWMHPDSTYHDLVEESSSDGNDRDALSFEAISYARGSTHSAQQVLVECSSQPQGFACIVIGQNLASALRHLRHEETARTLWADAVCVDTSNPEEQHAHVIRLADIFSRASRVVAWLGPASEDSDEAFDKLRHLGEQVVPVENSGWLPSPDAAELDWYRPGVKLPFSKEIINSVEKLLRRDWFQRMWVLQEIILASSQSIIQCGHSQMPWLIFSNAVCSLESRGKQFPQSFQDALQAPVQMTPNPKPWSIADIFRKYRTRQTTDPRDKVYGLLGLLPPEFRQKITPDYDAPVAKVYTDTALVLIEHTKRLDLLGVWNPEKSPNTDCPSWVLDFREPEPVRKPLSHQYCTLNSACHVRFQPPDELRVTGIKIAELEDGFRMPPVDKDVWDGPDEAMLEIIRRVTIPNLDTEKYMTGESLRQAYAISLVAGNLRSRIPNDTRFPNDIRWAELDEWCLQNSSNALFGERAVEGVTDMDNLSVSERDALDKVIGRAITFTTNGLIGLCPRAGQPGDVVAVILGCQSPMLLSPQPDGRYKILGECYMHGLADGAALVGLVPGPREVKIFKGPGGLWDAWGIWNSETREWDPEDGRLSRAWLSDVWESTEIERTRNDPAICRFFRNKVTGEVVNSDPRFEPEILRTKNGVELEEIVLI